MDQYIFNLHVSGDMLYIEERETRGGDIIKSMSIRLSSITYISVAPKDLKNTKYGIIINGLKSSYTSELYVDFGENLQPLYQIVNKMHQYIGGYLQASPELLGEENSSGKSIICSSSNDDGLFDTVAACTIGVCLGASI